MQEQVRLEGLSVKVLLYSGSSFRQDVHYYLNSPYLAANPPRRNRYISLSSWFSSISTSSGELCRVLQERVFFIIFSFSFISFTTSRFFSQSYIIYHNNLYILSKISRKYLPFSFAFDVQDEISRYSEKIR